MSSKIARSALLTTALVLSAVALWIGCFAPTYADCAFRCASTEPKCPAEYQCMSDGYCHLPDSTTLCAIPKIPDLAGTVLPDLSTPDDASPAGD